MPSQQPQPAGTGQRPQPDQLAGLVERVTFHSDESGYCVLRIKARGHRDLVTVVGTLPEVRAGEWLEAQGRWIVNKEYGRLDLGHASVFDAEFLTEQLGFLLESVVVGGKAYSGVDAVGGQPLAQVMA